MVRIVRAVMVLVLAFPTAHAVDTGGDRAGQEQQTGRSQDGAGIPAKHLDRIVEQTNRGVTLMDQYLPGKAVDAFAEVVELAPTWPTGRLNLAIAYLNTQVEENYARSEQELRRVIGLDPPNPHAHYCLGVLLSYLARFDEAKPHFEAVLEHDPEDEHSYYQLGALSAAEDPQAARLYLEKALELVPNHESACYRLARIYRQLGEMERSTEMLQRFMHLTKTKTGVATRTQYGEMGRYAEVIRAFERPSKDRPRLQTPPVYTDRAAEVGLSMTLAGQPGWPGETRTAKTDDLAGLFGPGVATADVDGDGDLDVYIPGAGADSTGGLYLWDNDSFTAATNSGISGDNAVAAYFGDYDADGAVDLFLTCSGTNRLYHNTGSGQYTDVTNSSGIGGDRLLSLGAAWADADHDGDLDLFVANFARINSDSSTSPGAPNNLWRNNSDGTFTDVAGEAGVEGGVTASTGVAFLDADNDRDIDLYVVNDRSANQLYLNLRSGRYKDGSLRFPALSDEGPGLGCVLGDVNLDGHEDLLLLRGPEPPSLFLRVGRDRFERDRTFDDSARSLSGAVGGSLADVDLDGDLDLVLVGAEVEGKFGHRVSMNDGAGRFGRAFRLGDEAESQAARGAAVADFTGDGAVELLVALAGSSLQFWQTSPPPGAHWLSILPSSGPTKGRPGTDAAGVGLLVEVKTGRHLQVARIASSEGYLGGRSARAHFGLGERGRIDYVRFMWPDAVLQSELEVPADQRWKVNKINRKPSSCPVLFSWDGERFAFVTDMLGGGGIGFFVHPGLSSPPDPDEDIRIPPEQIAKEGGRYLLRIAEPLEEVVYLDELGLLAYDHPSGSEVYPDERFTGEAPWATGAPVCVSGKVLPVSAVNDRGEDVMGQLRAIDRRYVEPPVDPAFTGYAREHWLELDFGSRLSKVGRDSKLVLFLHGWVEYTYSHINFAAHQAGVDMSPPRIELPDGRGGWETVVEMGFPAGLPRMMTVDISALPLHDQGRLRIRSNMEVFWDQIFVGESMPESRIYTHSMAPTVAELRYLGYPREYSPDGASPTLYDYHRLDHGVPFKSMSGAFTRLGDVRPLLSATDDRFVIMGKGEEIALEFDASELPSLPDGWSRTLVLHSVGYCKDMNLYTAYPDTVHPLPYQAMPNYPPDRPYPETSVNLTYQRDWNTRNIVGQ